MVSLPNHDLPEFRVTPLLYFGFAVDQCIVPATQGMSAWPLVETSRRRVTNAFGFNYERGLDAMLQVLRIQSESVLVQIHADGASDRIDTGYNRCSLVGVLLPCYAMVGCGGHGYATNSANRSAYYRTPIVYSHCDDFYNCPVPVDPISRGQARHLRCVKELRPWLSALVAASFARVRGDWHRLKTRRLVWLFVASPRCDDDESRYLWHQLRNRLVRRHQRQSSWRMQWQ